MSPIIALAVKVGPSVGQRRRMVSEGARLAQKGRRLTFLASIRGFGAPHP